MKQFDGTLLKKVLKMRRVTQRKLGEDLFISEKTISNWVNGDGEPSSSTLFNIATYLRVPPNIFMTETEQNEKTYATEQELSRPNTNLPRDRM